MERYNPFAADQAASSSSTSGGRLSEDDRDPFAASSRPSISSTASTSLAGGTQAQFNRNQNLFPTASAAPAATASDSSEQETPPPLSSSRYTTSFPDPFGDEHTPTPGPRVTPITPVRQTTTTATTARQQAGGNSSNNRSNSVTFLHKVGTDRNDDATELGGSPRHPGQRGGRHQAGGGLTSFLSRATSVTSSTVTDRVSGAVGSMRSAVDSLSSQFQQASGSSDRLSGAGDISQAQYSGAASLQGSPAGAATGSDLSQSQALAATICRQRVVLIIDSQGSAGGGIDWAQQFNQYRRLVRGLPAQSSTSLAISSFFTSQFSGGGGSGGTTSATSGSGGPQVDPGADLIEQVSFSKDVSVLANQSSGTAAVHVSNVQATAPAPASSGFSPALPSQMVSRLASLNLGVGGGSSESSSQLANAVSGSISGAGGNQAAPNSKLIRPEFVVVRQRGREQHEHLKSLVKALDYCLVPTFEPYDTWAIFQDRQLIFAKLLRVQRKLGKEHFPLIPQIYCQTHRDLTNYIQNCQNQASSARGHVVASSSHGLHLPFLVRTGPLGRGKIRIDNLQMLRDFATIMATSDQMSCTIEQNLEVKCDLVVQRLGTSLKLFKRNYARKGSTAAAAQHEQDAISQAAAVAAASDSPTAQRSSASRQTSLGAGVLSSFISSTGGSGGSGGASGSSNMSNSQQQVAQASSRRSSNPAHCATGAATGSFEKMADVNARYRRWVEAITAEFDNKLDAFCIKIAVASNDREYIVGLRNCSMDFLGSQENQDEDKRSFVELIISKMNTILPTTKPQPQHQSASREASSTTAAAAATASAHDVRRTSGAKEDEDSRQQLLLRSSSTRLSGDKRPTATAYASQTDIGGAGTQTGTQLNNRSRSVSINQSESPARASYAATTQQQQVAGSGSQLHSPLGARRSSERADSDSLLASDEFSLSPGGTGGLGNNARAGGGSSGQGQGQGPGPGAYQRQFSLGQSFFDQTSTALSSFQRQSMSFLKRLDSRTGSEMSSCAGTPPLSAKSDLGFDRNFERGTSGVGEHSRQGLLTNGSLVGGSLEAGGLSGSGIAGRSASGKSQSIDVSSRLESSGGLRSGAGGTPPPKPPPPFAGSLPGRQSSLANYSSSSMGGGGGGGGVSRSGSQRRADSTSRAPNAAGHANATITPQNSLAQSSFSADSTCEPFASSTSTGGTAAAAAGAALPTSQRQNQRVVRQNSALSAFEPFDPSLRSESQHVIENLRAAGQSAAPGAGAATTTTTTTTPAPRRVSSGEGPDPVQRAATSKYDNISMTSGTSNTSEETTSANTTSTTEDTMNNLKKTFATIFGDRCEG